MNKWIEGMGKLMEKAKRVFLRTETKKMEEAEERGEEIIEAVGKTIDMAYVPKRTINKEWDISKQIEEMSEEIGKRGMERKRVECFSCHFLLTYKGKRGMERKRVE